MPDTQLLLGGISFQGFEIPERINFGGTQRLVVHKLVGGNRTVDALGSDGDDIEWSGRFRGSSALQRAQAIDRMRQLGQPVTLTWGGLTYQVVIAVASFQYERSYEIPYRISCTLAQAEIPPQAASQTVDSLVGDDLGDIGTAISDAQSSVSAVFADMAEPLSQISGYVGTASTAISALNGLAGLPTSQVTGIVTALNSAQTATLGAVQICDGNIFTGASQIGGVTPSSPTGSANSLIGQIAALQTLSSLVVTRGQLGRAANNVSNAGSS
jgi:hypothetical protein